MGGEFGCYQEGWRGAIRDQVYMQEGVGVQGTAIEDKDM